jgi:lipid A 4'-phosphatase
MNLSTEPDRRSTPAAFWWTAGCLVVLALVPTVWTALDIQAAGIFIGPHAVLQSVQWPWVEWINLYIPAAFRTLLFLALALWILTYAVPAYRRWRFFLAFFVIAGTLGPGLVVNMGFKDNWQRARPYQVTQFGGAQQFTRATVMTDQCDNNCSFVSGHVSCGFFFAGIALLHRRRQWLWSLAGVSAGLLIGFARMSDGAHWLSDVLWAGPITLACSWLVWKVVLRHNGPA